MDCAGTPNGDAAVDVCGVCGGDGIGPGQCSCAGDMDDCLGVCGGSATPAECSPATCGSVDDGCGGQMDCGGCGQDYACEDNACVCASGRTCESHGAECGTILDGCSGTLDATGAVTFGRLECGDCPETHTCEDNVCTCEPLECSQWHCGAKPDGCGGSLSCGGCPFGYTCSGFDCQINSVRRCLELSY